MPKLAANLTMMYCERPFSERFAAASASGFKGVECHFPYDWSKEEISNLLAANDLKQVLFNLPAGDWQSGERGLAALPGREAEFIDGCGKAIEYARALSCHRLHAMAGIIKNDTDSGAMEDVFVGNLKIAAQMCHEAGIQLLIEPINNIDTPGYFLTSIKQATSIIDAVSSNNLFLQFDVYHQQIMEGNIAHSLASTLPLIKHIQIASVPGRHEPKDGEINYPWILQHLDEIGYQGWVGCEYNPKVNTQDGLEWARPWGIGKHFE